MCDRCGFHAICCVSKATISEKKATISEKKAVITTCKKKLFTLIAYLKQLFFAAIKNPPGMGGVQSGDWFCKLNHHAPDVAHLTALW